MVFGFFRQRKLGRLRATAEEGLWRRYNIVGDLVLHASGHGAPDTERLLDAVTAARDVIMKVRADPAARSAAEDSLQRALNAYYVAAYADDGVMSEHEAVMVLAHLTRADVRAFEGCAAYDSAAGAKVTAPLALIARLFGIEPATPMGLCVRPAVAV